jgi:hypothetical protein
MTELWLKYTDENGDEGRVRVDTDCFIVGRHSGNNLAIPNGKLSREHLKIDRYADDFVVMDMGSSNGTKLNGSDLREPAMIRGGEVLDLGGGAFIETELISDKPAEPPPAEAASPEPAAAPAVQAAPQAAAAAPAGGGSMLTTILIIAPVIGIVLIVVVGGAVLLLGSGGKTVTKTTDDPVYVSHSDEPTPEKSKDRTDAKTAETPDDNSAASASPTPDMSGLPTPKSNSETGKSEQNAAAFLRLIAQNDSKAFLTGEQAQIVNDKIKQLSGSAAIVDNINSARKSSAQIKSLAAAKSLKPQFLAAAAIAKLGGSRGDALQTAQGMSETLDKLGKQIGNEFASDTLLTIAAYDQGEAGDFMKMRNMLQDVSTKSTESSRAVRTIWFLHKNNKITDAEFDFAVRFLAIGTIMQNPKDFGVNTEALVL